MPVGARRPSCSRATMRGDLDRDFEWWDLETDRLSILPQLPFAKERTDVLTCQSKTDIENINLMATLLSHHQARGYWEHLGRRFVADLEAGSSAILSKGSLRSPRSTRRRGRRLTTRDSFPPFKSSWRMHSKSMHGLRHWWRRGTSDRPGILAETQALLHHYRAELLAEFGSWLSGRRERRDEKEEAVNWRPRRTIKRDHPMRGW